MKEFSFAIALALTNVMSPRATPEAESAKSGNCMGCHGVSKKMLARPRKT